jgi:hypothetical protein
VRKCHPQILKGWCLKRKKVGSAVAKWAEAAPGAVTQAHKDAFSCYRRAVKETPKTAKVTELAELSDIAVLATTPSAFFGLGDDKTCFAPGRLNYHHKYYLTLLDNLFVLYLLSKGKRRGRMWGREEDDGFTFYITNVYGVARPDAQRTAKQALEGLFPHWDVGEPVSVSRQ